MAPVLTSLLTFLAAASVVLAIPAPAPAPHSGGSGGSRGSRILGVPVSNPNVRNAIANSYIVVYNQNMTDDVIDTYQANVMVKVAKRNVERRELHNANLKRSQRNKSAAAASLVDTTMRSFRVNNFRAMAIRDTDDLTMIDMFNAAEVAYIEQDARVEALALTSETNATSGLSRISRAAVDTAGRTAGFDYTFDSTAGTGITAYIIDTGIQVNHTEFEGRATFGANFANKVDTDENGHGTHVSGTIGGATFGVAKNVQLVGVKVLDADGAGTNSDVIAGMNWVAANATASGLSGKAVLNMSLGGSRSRAVNAAINGLVAAGVVPVVAAGNENEDAIASSPASATGAIAVGAIDQLTDRKASFSNFGTTVALFAPGVNVLSSWISAVSTSETNIISGTSMASPHVAGLAAYLMSLEGLTSSATVRARMEELADATGAAVRNNVAGTTSRIVNNGNL
ncbi:serine protease [Ophiostoma piceae UAMH 11346]|uniref:Serine protease n=1 Tax=Ophiostoma piceae (strain UAMH 11346) TaxID=1262450 RepID=S3C9A9_OPHP1|nr:serine protease [Ophiostoma piceae UAMH 11346]